jgi:hypothetical protein
MGGTVGGQTISELYAYLLGFSSALSDPLSCLRPGLVESEKTGLATALYELIRLRDKLGVVNPRLDLAVRGDSIGFGIPGDLGDTGHRVLEVGLDLGMGRNGRCSLEPVRKEEFCVVFADG